jgi:hypothetical protein
MFWFWVVFTDALLLGLGAAVGWLAIELKAMQKSTHQVTYINPFTGVSDKVDPIPPVTDEERESLRRPTFDNLT